MQVTIYGEGASRVAVVRGQDAFMPDAQTALDVMMNVCVAHDEIHTLVFEKESLPEAFFDLRTNIAGEILQKFTNYRFRVAFVGDYAGYTSKALRDFIYESNKGNSVFFVETLEQALECLQKG